MGVEVSAEFDSCPCGQEIKEHCYIKNHLTGVHTYVGNICINRFLGIQTGNLFDGLRRFSEDDKANVNLDLIGYAYNFESEYGFVMKTRLKRKLSEKQILWSKKLIAES